MSASTTNYLPLDSDAPPVFSLQMTNDRVYVAFTILMLYDHIITLDMEIEWIWTLRWRLPKFIFIINRYLLTSLIMLGSIPQTIYPLPISFCIFYNRFPPWVPIFTFCAAELLMIIRVCSLYGHRKLVLRSLCGCFVAALAVTIVMQVLYMRSYTTTLYYEFLPGCFFWNYHPGSTIEWRVWIPALSLESVLLLLTVYKAISYRNETVQTITTLARDSVVYFVIVVVGLALTVSDDIHPFVSLLGFPTLFATQCIVSISIGRMMMNIRGLTMDDPEHTVHLKTLEFANHHFSGSEIEERD